LGRGLEGAYALSKNAKLRSLSEQLGRTLWNNVHPDGVTPYRVGGGNGGMGCHTLAESGTSLLEYRYLEQLCHQDAGPKPNCVEFAERPAEFFANMAPQPRRAMAQLLRAIVGQDHVRGRRRLVLRVPSPEHKYAGVLSWLMFTLPFGRKPVYA
jgi:hypothetical protein